MGAESCVAETVFPSIEQAKKTLIKWGMIDKGLTILKRTTRQIGNPLYAGTIVLPAVKVAPTVIGVTPLHDKDEDIQEYCRRKFFETYKSGIMAMGSIPIKAKELFGDIDVKVAVSPVFIEDREYVAPEIFIMINFNRAVVTEEKIDTLNSFIEKSIKAFG